MLTDQQRYWPALFEPELPGCPRCHRIVQLNSTKCGSCQFHLDGLLESVRTKQAPLLTPITDRTQTLSQDEQTEIQSAINRLQKRLPELFISINILPVPSQTTNEIYSFWWLNCAPNPLRDRHFTSLFLIDPIRPAISLSLGYRIEAFVPIAPLQDLLSDITLPPRSTEEFTEELVELISNYEKLLIRSFREAHKIARSQKL